MCRGCSHSRGKTQLLDARRPAGFTNVVVRKLAGTFELDPHVDRSCVITLDEDEARVRFEALRDWLG
jgi:hypothetical protein